MAGHEQASGFQKLTSSCSMSAIDSLCESDYDIDQVSSNDSDMDSLIEEEEESDTQLAVACKLVNQGEHVQQQFPHVDVEQSLKLTHAIQAMDYDLLCNTLRSIGLSPATYKGPVGNLLHIVTLFGPATFVPKLVADGIDVNEQNVEGDTALHIAARSGRSSIIDALLVCKDIDDSIVNNADLTPYQVAKTRQIATAIEYSRSLYITRKTKEMHELVSAGNEEGLRNLFSGHRNKVVLNIDTPDAHGDTVLHASAKNDNLQMIRCCLDLGADAYLKNKRGKLPIELTKDEEIKTVLKAAPMIASKETSGILSTKTRLEGYLNKWTNYAEGYKKRWFVLEEGILSYYKSQMEYPVSCRGSINMQYAKVHRHHSDKLRFEVISITNASTKIHIRAENIAEAQRWIIALNQASISSASTSDVDLQNGSSEPLVMALNTTDSYKDLMSQALSNLSELEILLNSFINPPIGMDPPKLSVENTVNYIFKIREALLSAEEHERQWKRKYEFEKNQKRILEDSFQKLAIENSRIEKYTRIKAIEEIKGTPIFREDITDETAVDEFYDALETEIQEAQILEKGELAPRADVLVDLEFIAAQLIGYPVKFRSSIPCDSSAMPPVSLWSILKNAIGKDLTRIPIPVNYCEPVSMLQRLCEEMEYAELIDAAWCCKDPLMRIQYIAAFSASSYASTDGRITKPFNPVLGETFEYVSPERGYRYISEQVSHHPPISACHCESSKYIIWAEVNVSSKFVVPRLELTPEGFCHLILKGVGANGEDEHYSWKKVKTSINNIVVGKLWIDHFGEMNIKCHQSGVTCKLDFKATGWRTVEPKKIEGEVTSTDGTVTHKIQGFWNSRLSSKNLETGETFDLWRKNPLPHNSDLMYKFTNFTMTLNEIDDKLKAHLAPTDSRFRPDSRAMESGDFQAANQLKGNLEEKHRTARKLLEMQGLCQPGPRWFRKVEEPNTGAAHWEFNGEYWKLRERQDWSDLPLLFEI